MVIDYNLKIIHEGKEYTKYVEYGRYTEHIAEMFRDIKVREIEIIPLVMPFRELASELKKLGISVEKIPQMHINILEVLVKVASYSEFRNALREYGYVNLGYAEFLGKEYEMYGKAINKFVTNIYVEPVPIGKTVSTDALRIALNYLTDYASLYIHDNHVDVELCFETSNLDKIIDAFVNAGYSVHLLKCTEMCLSCFENFEKSIEKIQEVCRDKYVGLAINSRGNITVISSEENVEKILRLGLRNVTSIIGV